jgi:hypothetical protein
MRRREAELDTDRDRAATLQLVIALGRTVQALERGVRPHLAECGLGLTEFAVLEVLYHKGALPLGRAGPRVSGSLRTIEAYVPQEILARYLDF